MASDELDPRQIEAWRSMSGQKKYDVFRAHMRMVRRVKRAGLVAQHPEWSPERIERELALSFLYGRT